MERKVKMQYWAEFCIDFSALFISCTISSLIFIFLVPKIALPTAILWIEYYFIMFVSYAIVFAAFHKSLDIHIRSKFQESINLLKNDTLVFIFFVVLLTLKKSQVFSSRLNMIISFVIFVFLSAAGRFALKKILTSKRNLKTFSTYVGILTTTDRAEDLVNVINKDWSVEITGVALLDNFIDENGRFTYDSELYFNADNTLKKSVATKRRFPHIIADSIPVIATDVRFIDWIRSSPLDEVYIDLPYRVSSDVYEIVEELETMGVTVHINVPSLDNMLDKSSFNNIHCHSYNEQAMATFSPTVHNESKLAIKRLVDIAGGLAGALVSIPIILITAIPLLIESPGPLIFKQDRVGKNGRLFKIYKLRSMYPDAEKRKKELMEHNKMDGLMFKMDNDPRITKVGRIIRKLSIDELPQFFNVIKGDMSLIGTRPPTLNEFNQYESRHKRRLSMRPGITGMWQVSGRSDIQDFEEVVKLDCEYIDNWSFGLDIKILLKTIKVVLAHEGAE